MDAGKIKDHLRNALILVGILDFHEEIIQRMERIFTIQTLLEYSQEELVAFFQGMMKIVSIQKIRSLGARIEEIEDEYIGETQLLRLLIHLKLIETDRWYKFNVFKLTTLGEQISELLITARIQEFDRKKLFNELSPFSIWLLNKYLHDEDTVPITFDPGFRGSNMAMFPAVSPGKSINDTISIWIKEFKTWQKEITTILKTLEQKKLVFKAFSFVSTNRGELRKQHYCIPSTLKQFIGKLVNTRYKEVEKHLDERTKELEKQYFSLQFFDMQIFYLGNWETGELNYEKALNAFQSDYASFQEEILETLEKLRPALFVDSKAHHFRLPEIHIKSPMKFLEIYKQLSNEILESISQMSQLPLLEPISQEPEHEPQELTRRSKTTEPKIRSKKKKVSIPPSSDMKFLLGFDTNDKEVCWEPKKEKNWSLAIVGGAGTGKTQTVKSILSEFLKYNLPYIIFDFRSDFLSETRESEFGKVIDLNRISINPLELDGNNTPKDQKFQISSILDLVYKIGDLQIGYIRNAIKRSYEAKGIREEDLTISGKELPTFDDIKTQLDQMYEEGDSSTKHSIKGIFARLEPIFDYSIFTAETEMPFAEIFRGLTVVDLGALPSNEIKKIVCEFFLRKLRYYFDKIGESREMRFYIVIDEAHRLKYDKESSAGHLLKEARKYGVGLLLVTQDPPDFTDVVYNNIGGIISFQLTSPKYAKKVAEHLGGKVTWQNVKNDLSAKFSAYGKFSSDPNAIEFSVIPHYQRKN